MPGWRETLAYGPSWAAVWLALWLHGHGWLGWWWATTPCILLFVCSRYLHEWAWRKRERRRAQMGDAAHLAVVTRDQKHG